jgi:RNA polymerase sigma-70 factor (ECF subfamily)
MPAPRPDSSSSAPFPTTRWSRVLAAGDRADPEAGEALAELCAAYWYPLYAFVRRKGYPPEEAGDLVQGTFLALLDRDGLAAVAPHRGRFRSFLLAVCAHHLADCRDRDRAAKRGGGRVAVAIDRPVAEGRYASEPASALTAERLFERRWATSLLEHAMARLEGESTALGKGVLMARLLPTLTGGRGKVPLTAIAAELGMTEGAVKMAASRLRRRYGAILREEIARTLTNPDDVEEEIRDLFAVLAG